MDVNVDGRAIMQPYLGVATAGLRAHGVMPFNQNRRRTCPRRELSRHGESNGTRSNDLYNSPKKESHTLASCFSSRVSENLHATSRQTSQKGGRG